MPNYYTFNPKFHHYRFTKKFLPTAHQLKETSGDLVAQQYFSISYLLWMNFLGAAGNNNQFREGLGRREQMDSVRGLKVPVEQIFLLFILVLFKSDLNFFSLWRQRGNYSKRAFCAV